jgi:hypothetical protein
MDVINSHVAATREGAADCATGLDSHKMRHSHEMPLQNKKVTGVLNLLLFAAAMVSARADFITDREKMRNTPSETYVCTRANSPIVIDGKLDEPAWQNAPWTHDFQDIEGRVKPKPRFRTRAKMLWDDNYFYVAAELEEPHVWATLTSHDAVIFQDPDFEVFIDPDADRHNYYEFEMNALNTTWDLLLKKPYVDGGPALNEWEIAGLKTAVHVNGTINKASDQDQSWSIEIAFPWKALAQYCKQKSPPAEGDIWRVDFSRVEWQIQIENGNYRKVSGKKEDNWVWSPMGIIDMHRPEKWGYVKFTHSAGRQNFKAPSDARAEALLDFYYMEKEFQSRNKRWATTLGELYGTFTPRFHGVSTTFRSKPHGFEATVSDKKQPLLHISEDGLLWRDN